MLNIIAEIFGLAITNQISYWRANTLTRSVQVAVVLSFSSISFPIFWTITWVCLMALWAVWSLQAERDINLQTTSLFMTTFWSTEAGLSWKCVSKRPLNWQAAPVLGLHQHITSFSLDINSDWLGSNVNYHWLHTVLPSLGDSFGLIVIVWLNFESLKLQRLAVRFWQLKKNYKEHS